VPVIRCDSVIRILPPLIVTRAEVEEVAARLVPVVRAFLAQA
jgi:acetylornithine aminotransferase